MSIVSAATRAVTRTADMTTAAAGAIGGAAVSGVIGGLQGAASGIRAGLGDGSRSSAAAALTIGAIGAAGLVEWPLLVTVGGAALVVHKLGQRSGGSAGDGTPALRSVATAKNQASERNSAKPTPRKTATSTTRNPSRAAKKSTSARRTTTK
ncbi:hypothetical protein [Mycobacterium sp. IDR2000157661]|uniref:hypothetical protein n=1 Tax=Mycobacterium sp. IDR2000157661 TaxID=2867005 RepID=UPI001EEBED59|nr:hypothetical protein [Mycobacterium sp. IDR2000157661]ULE33389.1 hypothetical protein K3G64_01290 [Mycobacterium sp. IDR2000157661]